VGAMSSIYIWFSGLATIGGFAYFMLGFCTSYLLYIVRQKIRHRGIRIPWLRAGIAVGISAIVIVSMQSSIAYNLANATAQEVKDCQHEFNTVLRARAKLAEENDNWSQIQRKALGDWLRTIVSPPPDIVALQDANPNDPKARAWGIKVTLHYSQIIQDAQKQQDEVLAERATHPLPAPTCGA
jgi:predicted PurR-regulated permease PerM